MDVRHIQTNRSSIASGRVRLEAQVACDDKTIPTEVYWYDVPEKYAEYLSESGNPWLACLIPLAVNLGEPLRISRPVDRALYANIHELMQIWKCWYPHLQPVPVEAEIIDRPLQRPGATAALFSGGVDAWFTLLRHGKDSGRADRIPIDDLLCVWGLDISLANADDFRAMHNRLAQATSGFEVTFVDIATNLHETKWWKRADWGRLAHGCGLASIALALEKRYARLLVPSTHRYDDLVPWGSHPLTDPLLSTETTRIIHDGAAYSRVEKTELLTQCDAALNSLQVCWETKCYRNCEACGKCYRTMITLMLLGALERCPTFKATSVDPKKITRIICEDESDRALLREVRTLAVNKGRFDVVCAIDKSFRRSRRVQKWLPTIRLLQGKRFVWRLAHLLKQRGWPVC